MTSASFQVSPSSASTCTATAPSLILNSLNVMKNYGIRYIKFIKSTGSPFFRLIIRVFANDEIKREIKRSKNSEY